MLTKDNLYYKVQLRNIKDSIEYKDINTLKNENDIKVSELEKIIDEMKEQVRELREDNDRNMIQNEFNEREIDELEAKNKTLKKRMKELTVIPSYLSDKFKEYWDKSEVDKECEICIEPMTKETFYLSKCGHFFCTVCKSKMTECPSCRLTLPSDPAPTLTDEEAATMFVMNMLDEDNRHSLFRIAMF
jgi:hypothetical protein